METKNKAILNSETEFTRLTTKYYNNSTANRFIPRAVYQRLSFAISIEFFLQCPILLVQKRKKTAARSRLPIQTRTTGKKVKDPRKYFHLVAGTCPTNSTHEGTKHSLWD